MRLPLGFLLGWLALVPGPDAYGQQEAGSPSLSSYHRARAIVDRALAAMGPSGGAISSLVVEGTGYEDLTAELQGMSPEAESRRPHREILAVDVASGGVAYERHTARNDRSLRWRRFILTPDARGVVDFTTGFSSLRAAPVPDTERAAYRRRVPLFLLQELAQRPAGLRWLGQTSRQGKTLDLVAAPLPTGEQLVMFFDAAPQLARVEYLLEFPGLGDTPIEIEYPIWASHPRLGRFPTGHRVLVGERVLQDVTYSRVLVDDSSAANYLRVPAQPGGSQRAAPRPMAPMRAAPPPGTASMVADGVYLVEDLAGFDLMFVDLGGEVLVAEAPGAHPFLDAIPARNYPPGPPVSREYLSLIQRTLPGLPIRYLVLSHHHSDHLGGVREFIAAGATVLAPPGDTALVRRISRLPHTLKSNLSHFAADARIETVNGRRVISGRDRSVEIHQVGPNPHTDDNLLLWIPASRILFQGDLFYFSQGEPPPVDRETMNRFFGDWVAKQGLRPARIYGMHNDGFATLDDLPRR